MAQAFEAMLGFDGSVIRGPEISQSDAETRRRQGLDVVVCGVEITLNRQLAREIESVASGSYEQHQPHRSRGRKALPHFQPKSRPPEGHTFYETRYRKAE